MCVCVCVFLEVSWSVRYLRIWMLSSLAVASAGSDSQSCSPRWGRKCWFWSSMTGQGDAAIHFVKRALSLTLVSLLDLLLRLVDKIRPIFQTSGLCLA